MNVKFMKTDGTERNMKCTLLTQFLPISDVKKIEEGKMKAGNENILAVWDLDNQGWRSFRIDSVLSFEEV